METPLKRQRAEDMPDVVLRAVATKLSRKKTRKEPMDNIKSTSLPMKTRQAYLREAINDITLQLKGPLSDVERYWLVADRRAFREELIKLEQPQWIS